MGRGFMGRETKTFWNSQFDTSLNVPDYAAWEDRHESLSALADAHGTPKRIPTGAGNSQAVWRNAVGRSTHAMVFVHGGTWSGRCADNFTFAAETAVASNATFYNVDYRHMPEACMEDLVTDVTEGCRVAMDSADTVLLVGHSAGAHLAVEAAMRLPRPPLAVVAISGIYDLDPLRFASLQDDLLLTEDDVRRFSPRQRAHEMRCPLHLRAGGDETFEYRRQAARMFEAMESAGGAATIEFNDNHHHSSIVAELADPTSVLSHLVQNLLA